MKVYICDKNTKEFLYSEEAVADPLETEIKGEFVPLIPANATLKEPPQKEGFAAVYVGGVWELQEDNRGKEYWLPGDEYGTPARVMKELGAFPTDAVFIAPVKPFEMVKEEKIVELKSMRDTLEVEPIKYNGNYFDYDEKARDRINAAIIALDLAGADAKLSWNTADNKEAIVTANDLRGVIANVAIRSNELHVKYRGLREQVDKATTIVELEAIVW